MHNINAVALNLHDHNVYDGKLHKQMERYTRFKHNLKRKDGKLDTNNYDLNNEFVNEYFKKTDGILAFSYTIGGIRMIREILDKEFLDFKPKKLFDFVFKDDIYYCDHHQSHAVYAFFNSGFEKSDILAIDGIGAKFRCIFVDKDENR